MKKSNNELVEKQKKEFVTLKNVTYIKWIPFKKGQKIEVTPEIKKILKPFGYFKL